jgi:hypothetical protein
MKQGQAQPGRVAKWKWTWQETSRFDLFWHSAGFLQAVKRG